MNYSRGIAFLLLVLFVLPLQAADAEDPCARPRQGGDRQRLSTGE